MTSPAAGNGQKEEKGSKAASNASLAQSVGRNETPSEVDGMTPPLTAWWRVFKLVNLLMQTKC